MIKKLIGLFNSKGFYLGMAVTVAAAAHTSAQTSITVTSFASVIHPTYGYLAQATNGDFYGTSRYEGAYGQGYLYRVTPSGGFSIVLSFNGSNGVYPEGGLTIFGNKIFGVTPYGGLHGNGSVFTYDTSTGSFDWFSTYPYGNSPMTAPQTRDGVTIYYTMRNGGTFGKGCILAASNSILLWKTDFDGTNGSFPNSRLAWGATDGQLYGTAESSLTNTNGGIYRTNPTNGNTVLVGWFTNGSPAKKPNSLLAGPNGEFYGTTSRSNAAAIFRFIPGSSPVILHQFPNGDIGPTDLVWGPDGALFGTTMRGGADGDGNFYRLSTNGNYAEVLSLDEEEDGTEYPSGAILAKDGNFYFPTAAYEPGISNVILRVSVPMPTSVTSVSSSSNGLAFTLLTVAGQQYEGQGSTNLVDWVTIATMTATGSATTFTDTNKQPFLFYRGKILSTNDPSMDDNAFVAPPLSRGPYDFTSYPGTGAGGTSSTNTGDISPPQ